MLNLTNCTAVCLDTLNYEQARMAAERCDRAANFHDIFILSDRDTGFATKLVDHVSSIENYNDFIIDRLADYCETDFVLVFQWDGFITQPEEWSPEFMKYDYVGAPWFASFAPVPEVGNGGFSLRSHRLLDTCAGAKRPAGENEDIFVCRKVIPQNAELKMAPVDVARDFAVETSRWSGQSFGFHGSWHFPRFMVDEEVIERLSLQTSRFWETRQGLGWIHAARDAGKPGLARLILEACRKLEPVATSRWFE